MRGLRIARTSQTLREGQRFGHAVFDINELDTRVLNTLVEGEVLDIQYAYHDISTLTPDEIEDMLWKKTGALYKFCGTAGAMIGLGSKEHPYIDAVSQFAALCGTAFQLQDDLLDSFGSQEFFGKNRMY